MTDAIHKNIFSALKKCNQIGKKLSTSGLYILTDGMMIAYEDQNQDEVEAVGLGIAFIETKVMSKMDALPYMNILIDGNTLYQLSQDGEFLRFTTDSRNIYIEFKTVETEEVSDGFKSLALEKGFSEESIMSGLLTNFEKSDIDLYELYLKYKKENKTKTKSVVKKLECPIIHNLSKNKIIKKANKVINEICSSTFVGYKELQQEIYDRLYDASQPVEFKIVPDDENDVRVIRLMKSVLNGGSSKSNCELRLFDRDHYSYLIVELTVSGFVVCNIFKVVNF